MPLAPYQETLKANIEYLTCDCPKHFKAHELEDESTKDVLRDYVEHLEIQQSTNN